MNPVVARQWAQAHEPDRIAGWVKDTKSKPGLRNPAGYIGAMLKTREPAPKPGDGDKRRKGDIQTATCPTCWQVIVVEQVCPDCGRCWQCCECEGAD